MLRLHLYWKHDGEDVDLGHCYHDVLPPTGALITHVTDNGVVWQVRQVYLTAAEEGSMAVRDARDARRDRQVGQIHLFVEPADGPFEP